MTNGFHCANCGSPFTIEIVDEVSDGFARCACTRWPVIEGVRVLCAGAHFGGFGGRKQLDIAAMIAALEAREPRRARRLLIGDPIAAHLERLEDDGVSVTLRRYLSYLGPDASYPAVREYFLHRFTNPAYYCNRLLLELADPRGSFLDVSSGMCQMAWAALERLESPEQVTCLDLNPVSLHAARRCMLPAEVSVAVADASVPLPFAAERRFDTILWADAIYYFDDLPSACSRIAARLAPDGVLIVTNAYTRGGTGHVHTVDQYLNAFAGFCVRAMPSDCLKHAMVTGEKLDVDAIHSREALVRDESMALVVTRTPRPLGSIGAKPWPCTRPAKLVLNPCYTVVRTDRATLARRSDTPQLAHLPAEAELPAGFDAAQELPDAPPYAPLVERRVLFRVPINY